MSTPKLKKKKSAGNLKNILFSELCWGKAMVVDTKPQQGKIEEGERLTQEREG